MLFFLLKQDLILPISSTGNQPNLHLIPRLGKVEAMYNEGAPEYVVDQGLYYPTATDYGYYCTGFEAPIGWEDQAIFSTDGSNIQYVGANNESMPYVYYTPSTYGYTQSSYNPYDPYVSGTMMNDGSFVGQEQYYTIASSQNPASSAAMVPVVIQPEMIANSSSYPLLDFHASAANRAGGKVSKQTPATASAAYTRNPLKYAANRTNTLTRGDGPSKHSTAYSSPAPTHVRQGRSSTGSVPLTNEISSAKLPSHSDKLLAEPSVNASLSNFGSNATKGAILEKTQPKVNTEEVVNDGNDVSDTLSELNQGPGTGINKDQLSVKAYTTKAGGSDAEGNIVIYIDQYNRDDFVVDYDKAKFFVIKSFSEDDVHKSVKYNVWSSTSYGNKKLQAAYEDAQNLASGKPDGCPIFLFFSVNGSGQFCGVAEMIGPVNFEKSMDFWQQDKWSGSFPVKWHIIKDVPNPYFRRIILQNNEHKPVTHSRDAQEVMYNEGIEMLKVFKSYRVKTTLLDDFMFYEQRQEILLEEKARRLVKNFERPYFVSPAASATDQVLVHHQSMKDGKSVEHSDSVWLKKAAPASAEITSSLVSNTTAATTTNKTTEVTAEAKDGVDLVHQPMKDGKFVEHSDSVWLKKAAPVSAEITSSPVSNTTDATTINKTTEVPAEAEDDVSSTLQIGSLTITTKGAESKPSAIPAPVKIVTVGSIPVRVAESSGFVTIGSIPLDPAALKLGDAKGGA